MIGSESRISRSRGEFGGRGVGVRMGERPRALPRFFFM